MAAVLQHGCRYRLRCCSTHPFAASRVAPRRMLRKAPVTAIYESPRCRFAPGDSMAQGSAAATVFATSVASSVVPEAVKGAAALERLSRLAYIYAVQSTMMKIGYAVTATTANFIVSDAPEVSLEELQVSMVRDLPSAFANSIQEHLQAVAQARVTAATSGTLPDMGVPHLSASHPTCSTDLDLASHMPWTSSALDAWLAMPSLAPIDLEKELADVTAQIPLRQPQNMVLGSFRVLPEGQSTVLRDALGQGSDDFVGLDFSSGSTPSLWDLATPLEVGGGADAAPGELLASSYMGTEAVASRAASPTGFCFPDSELFAGSGAPGVLGPISNSIVPWVGVTYERFVIMQAMAAGAAIGRPLALPAQTLSAQRLLPGVGGSASASMFVGPQGPLLQLMAGLHAASQPNVVPSTGPVDYMAYLVAQALVNHGLSASVANRSALGQLPATAGTFDSGLVLGQSLALAPSAPRQVVPHGLYNNLLDIDRLSVIDLVFDPASGTWMWQPGAPLAVFSSPAPRYIISAGSSLGMLPGQLNLPSLISTPCSTPALLAAPAGPLALLTPSTALTSSPAELEEIVEQTSLLPPVVEWATAQLLGPKKGQEDRVSAGPLASATVMHAAVFDGHGGAETASVAGMMLPHLLAKELTEGDGLEGLASVVNKFDQQLEPVWKGECGSTAAIAMIADRTLVSLNVGDSSVFLIKSDGTAVPLSVLHNTENPAELERLRGLGAKLVLDRRVRNLWRVADCDGRRGMMVSRSLGDFKHKRQLGVNSDAHVVAVELDPTEDVAVVAVTDGVTDVLGADIIGSAVTDALVLGFEAKGVANQVLSWTEDVLGDNASVAVMLLKWC